MPYISLKQNNYNHFITNKNASCLEGQSGYIAEMLNAEFYATYLLHTHLLNFYQLMIVGRQDSTVTVNVFR